MSKRLALIVVTLAMAALPTVAGDTSQWRRVQRLRAGTRISIDLTDQRRVEGRFMRASETDLTYEASRETTVSRDTVVRISRRPRLSRKMRTLLGAAIGLAGGAIVNATLGAHFSNEGRDITAITLASGAAVGAGIGAITGGGYKTIYRSSTTAPASAAGKQ
ncbi:MAG: hypothetical protein ACLQPN_23360 [Bryobacteraceae bacterium]